jgi:hypothetical protein
MQSVVNGGLHHRSGKTKTIELVLSLFTKHAALKKSSINLVLLAHLAKGNVSFCHHLSSVNFSHFNLLL